MSHTHHSVFDYIARDDDAPAVAGRKALALASKRVEDRFGNFLARTAGDSIARLELIRDDFDAVVAAACEEVGYGDVGSLTRTIWNDRISRISGENPFAKKDEEEDEDDEEKDDKTSRTASTREARKPKLCPYHDEVMNISLAQGEPQAGYNAMASHAWSAKHCKGDEYDGGRCNFKPEMTTQSYWDTKAEKAEQRRQERQEQAEMQQVEPVAEVSDEAIGTLEDGFEVEQVEPLEGGEAEVDAGLPADELMSVAASTKRFVPLVPKTAGALEDALYQHAPQTRPEHMQATQRMGIEELSQYYLETGITTDPWEAQEMAERMHMHNNRQATRTAEQKKHLEGDKVTDKRQRQYEHIKKSCMDDGKSEEECKELAARTVNKQRAEKGETKDSAHIAEALEHQDVTKNTFPKMDRSNERPKDPPDTEMPGSPHPTKREDIQPDITVPRQKVQNDDPEDIGENVTERVDVTQESGFDRKYPNRWASADAAIANFNRMTMPDGKQRKIAGSVRKGLVTENGEVYVWPVDANGRPTHYEYEEREGLSMIGTRFSVLPDGSFDEDEPYWVDKIQEAHPDLHPGDESNWEFRQAGIAGHIGA